MIAKFININYKKDNPIIKLIGLILLVPVIYTLFVFHNAYLLIGTVILFFAVSFLAIKYPYFIISLLFITAIFPDIFIFTPDFYDSINNLFLIPGGLRFSDAVLLIMLFAALIKLFISNKVLFNLNLSFFISLLSIWFLFEIVRNYSTYGISAPGEFRFRYLILSFPLYITVIFDIPEKRKKLFKYLIIFSLVVPLLFIPYIGSVKGWIFGGEVNRFLPADINLGFIYGLTALFIGNKYKLFNYNKALISALTVIILFFVLLDAHRSVWLSAAVIILTLIFINEIYTKNSFIWLAASFIILILVYSLLAETGLNVFGYITERASAFLNPLADSTARWRIWIWEAQIEKFWHQPFLGQGFGGYWNVYVPTLGNVEYSPHSLYVQSLVKIGIIGLGLYLIVIFKVLKY